MLTRATLLALAHWPHARDVKYHDEWPMRQAALFFGARALDQPEYLSMWKSLPADSNVEEVVRNFFIRQPLLRDGREHR